MGMFKVNKHRYVDSRTDHVVNSNPNPKNFKVKECRKIGKIWVSKINYPDAKNFEGDKILITTWNPESMAAIDPHFSMNGGIIARFEPTDNGWKLALMFAKLILNSEY